jgi:hypothetical protein
MDDSENLLKGNFKTKNKINIEEINEGLEARFEKEALKKLGGSIAFVAKQKVIWEMKTENDK